MKRKFFASVGAVAVAVALFIGIGAASTGMSQVVVDGNATAEPTPILTVLDNTTGSPPTVLEEHGAECSIFVPETRDHISIDISAFPTGSCRFEIVAFLTGEPWVFRGIDLALPTGWQILNLTPPCGTEKPGGAGASLLHIEFTIARDATASTGSFTGVAHADPVGIGDCN